MKSIRIHVRIQHQTKINVQRTNAVEAWSRQNMGHFNASCRFEIRLAHYVSCESLYFRLTNNIVIMCGRLRFCGSDPFGCQRATSLEYVNRFHRRKIWATRTQKWLGSRSTVETKNKPKRKAQLKIIA